MSVLRRFFSHFGSSLDYVFNRNAPAVAGRPMRDASKISGDLIGYTAPSAINIERLRSNCRRALIDSPELISLVHALRVMVIGDGLKVSSAPERAFLPELGSINESQIKLYRKTIDTLWETCAESTDFDLLGERSLASLMQDAFEKWMQDGEVIVSFQIESDEAKLKNSLTPLRVALLLPEDMKTPRGVDRTVVIDGVEVDKTGIPVAYHINNVKVEKYGKASGRMQISILKMGQTLRGIPPLAPAVQMAKLLEDYQLNEAKKNALASEMFMAFTGDMAQKIAREQAMKNLHKDEHHHLHEDGWLDSGRRGVNMFHITTDSQLHAIETPKPSQTFTDFTTTIQKRIYLTLGMSRDIVTKDINSSYSAARLQSQLTDLEISVYRLRFIDAFLRPLYENWFMLATEQGHFPFVQNFEQPLHRKSWMAMEVIGRPMPDLSPLQEANALKTYLAMGVISRADIAKMLGFPKWEDTANTLSTEQETMSHITPTEGAKDADPAQQYRNN